MTLPTDPAAATSVAPDTTSPVPDTTTPPADQAAAEPTFGVGQVARLTTGEGDYQSTELVIVTADEGPADMPNADGTVDHLYTVSRVPQGHPVRGSQLTAV